VKVAGAVEAAADALLAALRAGDSDRAVHAIETHILQADPVTGNGSDPRPTTS